MSMGYLMQDNAPAVWRGPMVMNSVQQLLHKVDWGGLDVLVLDLPPGTGDVQLTITQQLELDGAVIVSTPQDLALKDAIRGVEMFKKVNVPILGLAENMAHFTCPVCSSRTSIFASSSTSSASDADRQSPSGAVHAKRHSPLWSSLNIPLLGSIPLAPRICSDADEGLPTVVAQPRSESALAFEELAGRVLQELGIAE
jgi:ATP-binding protein involved in chromosome partitioning